MYKAVLFDFGGVLFRYSDDKNKYEGPEGILKTNWDLWKQATHGEIDDMTVYEDIAKNYKIDKETIIKWLVSRREPIVENLEILKKIKPEIKKGVINNGLKTLFHLILDKFEYKQYFDVLINSQEEKSFKPDSKIYLAACKKLNLDPYECIFIDDNKELVEAAEKLGMKGILMTNSTALKNNLIELGVI